MAKCNHKFHFIRLDPPFWSQAICDTSWVALFVCENCGLIKKVKTTKEEK